MNKVDSLAFLDECLKKLDYASQEDISRYNEVYKENCTGDLEEGSFEFCVPKPNLSDSFVIEKDYSTCKIIYE